MPREKIQYVTFKTGFSDLTFEDLERSNNEILDFTPNLYCKKCNFTFNLNDFHISVVLHGLILCQRKSDYLYGITCPFCNQTVTNKCDQDQCENLKKSLHFFISKIGNYSYWPGEFSYYATPLYFLLDNPLFKQHKIYYSIDIPDTWALTQDRKTIVENLFMLADEHPSLNDMYRTYVPSMGGIFGFYCSVFWFEERETDNIIKTENEHNIMLLPRYFIKSGIHNNAEMFSWNNKYFEQYFENAISLCDNNKKQNDNNQSEKREKHFKLIENLLCKKADCYIEDRNWYCDPILSSKNPFWRKTNIDIDQLNHNKFTDKDFIRKIDCIYKELEPVAGKDYIKYFIDEHYKDYIDDYIDLIQRKDFCLSTIFNLNLKYLRQIYKIHRKEMLFEAKYAFYQEGPSWTITYNGTTIRGLRGKGFDYLHYLVSNKNESYYPEELIKIDGYSQEELENFDNVSTYKETNGLSNTTASSYDGIHPMDIFYGKSENELKQEYQRLINNKDGAELTNDPLIIKQAEDEYEHFINFFQEYILKGGKKKKFIKKEQKNLKNKLAINIKRALERIKKENLTIWKHFDESLSSPYSNDLYYRPLKDIDWKCQ